VTGLILAVSWAVFGLAALPVAAAERTACVFGFTALFGLGETTALPATGPGRRRTGRAAAAWW
jgi:hypothetical protein